MSKITVADHEIEFIYEGLSDRLKAESKTKVKIRLDKGELYPLVALNRGTKARVFLEMCENSLELGHVFAMLTGTSFVGNDAGTLMFKN